MNTSDNGGFLEHTCSLSQNPILFLCIRNCCVSSVRCEKEQARIAQMGSKRCPALFSGWYLLSAKLAM